MTILKTISIVIPVYNEEKFIKKTIEEVIKADSLGLKKEIVVVDDGSTDSTTLILKKIKNKSVKNNLVLILKKKNEGKGAALKDGFKNTSGDIVLVQDADLEYNPNNYSNLLMPIISGQADVVYGSRLVTAAPHRVLYYWHYLANKFLTSFSNVLTNLNLTDMETGFKIFRGDIVRKIAPKLQSKRFGFEPEITARISKISEIKIYEVGISYSGRTYKEGKKITWKDGIKALFEIIKYNLFTS